MSLKRQEVPQEYAPVYLRHMNNEDRFACYKIDRLAYGDGSRWDELTWHDIISTCPALVAVCGQTVVGFCVYSFTAESIVVVKLAVHPRHHRNGIGTILLGRIVETCREHARAFAEISIPLELTTQSVGAMTFLKVLGWYGYLVPARGERPELVSFIKENKRSV